jgi:hypothetical protein
MLWSVFGLTNALSGVGCIVTQDCGAVFDTAATAIPTTLDAVLTPAEVQATITAVQVSGARGILALVPVIAA